MTKLTNLLHTRAFWLVMVTAFVTWQLTDEDTYSRMVVRNSRRYVSYEIINWNANLDDAREASLTKQAKSKTR